MSKRPPPSPSSHPSKRRKGPPGQDDSTPSDPTQSLIQYLFHAQKILLKSLKLARTFEVQKLGRKVKGDEGGAKEKHEKAPTKEQLASFEEQLECLKTLPLPPLPLYLLHHRLPKLPFLTSFLPALQSSLSSSPSSEKESELDPKSTEFKARNRLFANRLVGEAWDEVKRALGKRCGVEVEVKSKTPAVAVAKESVKEEGKERQGEVGEGGKRLSKRAIRAEKARLKALEPKPKPPGMNEDRKKLLAEALALEEAAGNGDGGGDGNEDEEEDEADDDEEVRRELERLGGGGSDSEDDEEEEDGSMGDSEDSDSEDDEAGSDTSLPVPSKSKTLPPSKPTTIASTKSKPTAAATKPPKQTIKPLTKSQSTFLPSLSGTGYISYSDSDDESAKWVKEEENKDKKDKGRKNRRGQRARRAIWEQKYGSGANHVAKAAGTQPAKSKSSKSQTIATPRSSKPSTSSAPTPVEVAPEASGVNSMPLATERKKVVRDARDAGEVMHPSWEAKRKQKEAMEAALAGGGKSVGKKITFD